MKHKFFLLKALRFGGLFLLLVMAGCGDDSSPDNYNSLLKGQFRSVSFFNDDLTVYSTLSFDGNGNAEYENLSTSNNNLVSESFTYEVDGDGSFSVTYNSGEVSYGIVSFDGSIYTYSDTDGSDGYVGFGVGVRESSGMTNADLYGQFKSASYSNDNVTAYSSFSFDGKGEGEYTNISNSAGDLESETFTYEVASEGSVTMRVGSEERVSYGVLSAEGNLLLFTDTDLSNGDALMGFAIKESSEMSVASLKGRFISASVYSNPETFYSSGYYDGAGNGEYANLYASDNEPAYGAFTYEIEPDGGLTLAGEGGWSSYGMVNSGGDYFTFVDTDSSDGETGLGFAIKER